MDKRTECKIVQDLLLGYVDNTLNTESRKIVERHLLECENCREKLEEIKKDINENERNQQKEIDYLKKVRIKSKIKSVIFAVCIIFFIVLIIYLSKFIKISSIMNKANKSLETTNYYFESNEILSDGQVGIRKVYYKDGKYKETNEIYSEEDKKTFYIRYGEINSDKIIELNEESKKVYIKKGEISKIFNEEDNIKWNRYQSQERNSIIANLGKAFLMSIDKDTYDVGKEYYILRNQFEANQRWEVWIDKETGLVIREINKDAEKIFITGTDIVKEINDRITTYKYEFNIVTDEDVIVPDFSGYTVENVNTDFPE